MMKYVEIHLGVSILTCFWALEHVRRRLGDHPGMGTLKTTKKTLWGTFLCEPMCDICWYFCSDVFYMISKPLSCCLFAPRDTHRTQFWRLLTTKFGTDWANLEKWKQWFRVRGSIKIKPQRRYISIDLSLFMHMCSKPVFFVIPYLSLANSCKFCYA